MIKRIIQICFLLVSTTAFGSNFQNFLGINYTNPANLMVLVKQRQLIIGNDYIIPNIDFTGTITVPDPFLIQNVVTSGSVKNDTNFNMTYGRYAERLSPQWVVGVDITQPFKTYVMYPKASLARYAVTVANVSSLDIAPNVAYQFTGKLSQLSIGAGLDILQFFAEYDQKYPSLTIPFGAGQDAVIINHAKGWALGFHAGLLYQIAQGTFADIAYFSQFTPTVRGTSSYTGFPNTNANATINLPATTSAAITQFLSEDWFLRWRVNYTQWGRLEQAVIKNSSGPLSSVLILFNYKNTWETDLSTAYTLNSQFTLGGALAYDETPTNNVDRSLNLPEVNQIVIAINGTYKITKAWAAQLEYGHAFMVKRVPLNSVNPNDGTTVVGKATVSGDWVGLQLNYDI